MTCFICLFKIGFFQVMCMTSLSWNLKWEVSRSMTSKQIIFGFSCKCFNICEFLSFPQSAKIRNCWCISITQIGEVFIKIAKAELDIRFLNNCKLYNVIPKFICFNLPGTNKADSRFIRKRLLRSALKKREGELRKLKIDYDNILKDLRLKLTSFDIYIVKRCINHNVQNAVKNVIKTHEKKLRDLTKNINN